MRAVPADLELAAVPPDFSPEINDDGKVISWSGTVPGAPKRYELGHRPIRELEALEQARSDLIEGVWQLHEFARLGRYDLMAYASTMRHRDRPRRTAQRG